MSTWSRSSITGFYNYILFNGGPEFPAWADQNKINYKVIITFHNGTSRTDYIINADHHTALAAWLPRPIPLLFLGPVNRRDERPTVVLYPDGKLVHMGYIKNTNNVQHLDTYFYDEDAKTYFSINM